MRVAGIMSGTSLDGIDVAIIEIRGRRWQLLEHCTIPYPRKVRSALLSISNAVTHTATIARLHFLLGELYARALGDREVELVGCHGQTVFHEGTAVSFLGVKVSSTLQIGEAALIAERTGVPVISDFRPRDIAAGGKGAPLVPYVDYFLFRHPRRGRVALNIGGIANITAISPGAGPGEVIAFDTGPGNMAIDALVAEHTGGKQRFDRGGSIAARGAVDRKLLDRLLRAPFYKAKPPKTAGREQYGREFVTELLATGRGLPDLIATATAFTAAAVCEGIRRFVPFRVDDLIVSGGGAHNPVLMGYLAAFLPEAEVQTSTDFGIDIDAKEAIAFAILAYETWHRRPSNLPSATGARHPAILGKITM
ncbi:MAG: anhydro-N-acetylmuramic acid kinase [Bryobacteraceae bacterium]|nr:anhydro-N-acetylmuramic acid kinase [Bryobacterales bacterium]NUN01630.1 anhydro-N-acetylmuramic acid kinase [Bryobacteraceae bacterium]